MINVKFDRHTMPFGISCSSEILKRIMSRPIEGLTEVFSPFDNIVQNQNLLPVLVINWRKILCCETDKDTYM